MSTLTHTKLHKCLSEATKQSLKMVTKCHEQCQLEHIPSYIIVLKSRYKTIIKMSLSLDTTQS